MRVVFRADASLRIGTGHVMRCLTLADALSERASAQCHFVCRAHPGNLADLIRERGYRVTLLPPPDGAQSCEGAAVQVGSTYAAWLGVDWEVDGDQTLAAMQGDPVPDWLVVDHYSLNSHWESRVRGACHRLMVIDDLADRPHDCDLLLDQNLGRVAGDYANYIPAACKMLSGSQYALLRPEFARLRPESLARRARITSIEHLLISLGGVDNSNVTGRVLGALRKEDLPDGCRLTVVLGAHAPWLDAVNRQATTLPWRTDVLVNVRNIGRLMADSDLSVGAAGGTAWERCCLGVPTIMVVLAENQRATAVALGNRVVSLWSPDDVPGGLSPALRFAQEHLADLSALAGEVVDGGGAIRVRDVMEAYAVR